MKSKLVVMIAEVKYPTANASYLTANAYQVASDEDIRYAREDFVYNCEKDGFKIINYLAYFLPMQPILSMGALHLVWNHIQKPPKPVVD